MQVIRTIVWVMLLIVLLLFSIANWEPVQVKIWEELVFETKLPALVVISFLLGLGPMWLLHRAGQWRLQRRITSLENNLRTSAIAPPLATSTQLEQAAAEPEKPLPDVS